MSDYRRDNDRYSHRGAQHGSTRDGRQSAPRGDRHGDGRETRPPYSAGRDRRTTHADSPRRQQGYTRGQATAPHRPGSTNRAPHYTLPRQGSAYRRPPARNEYVDSQMRRHAPTSGNYRARQTRTLPSHGRAQMPSRLAPPAQQTSPRSLMIRAALVALLLIVLVVRFIVQGGIFAESRSVKAQVDDQQTQLEQLSGSNADMQSQMSSMQATIDAWNQKQSS